MSCGSSGVTPVRVGPGIGEGVEVGPLVSESQRRTVAELVDSARAEGARVVTGGEALPGPGFFYPPTVVTGLDLRSRLMTEEIFGPVAPVVAFDDEEELIALINSDTVGLGGYVHTKDVNRIMRLAERLEIGMIGMNSATISNAAAPFGGLKQSGMGREGGKEGIEEYLETVYIGIPAPRFLL